MSGLLNLVAVAAAALWCTSTLAEEQTPTIVATKYAALRAAITTLTNEVNAAKAAWLAADLAYNQNEQTAPALSATSSLPQYSQSQQLLQVSYQARVTLEGKTAMLEQAYWKLTAGGEGVSSTQYRATAVNADRMFQYSMAHYPMQLSLGKSHSCALYKSTWGAASAVKCWGSDAAKQLGNTGTTGSVNSFASATPVALGAGRTPVKVVAGKTATCALLDDKSIKCWGTNTHKQLGIASDDTSFETDTNAIAVVVLGSTFGVPNKAKDLEGNSNGETWCVILESVHSCCNALTMCWGSGAYGAIGMGTQGLNDRSAPEYQVNFGGGARFAKSLAIGESFGCAILNKNEVKCWGRNNYGQLGQGDTTDISDPYAIADVVLGTVGAPRSARLLAAGSTHVCAILDNNALKCWGQGSSHCLGNGGTAQLNAPAANGVNVGVGRYAVSLALGSLSTCAILDNYEVKCWGNNLQGQIGKGNFEPGQVTDASQVALQPPTTVIAALVHGELDVCAVLDNAQVWCWGVNSDAQLGDGHTMGRSAPVLIYTPPAR